MTIQQPGPTSNRGILRAIKPVVAALLLIGLAAPTLAQNKKPDYNVTVWAIRATKSNKDVSKELKPIIKDLRKNYKYTGFKLERKATKKVSEGAALSTGLIGEYSAKVTPTKRDGDRVTFTIEVTKKQGKSTKRLMRTSVTIDRGRFQLQGGWKIKTGSDDVLIVGVSAR